MNGIDILVNNNITSITNIGFWLLNEDKEYFVPFSDYPAFRKATLEDIFNYSYISPRQIYWQKHDIDIEIDALQNPNKFNLLFV